MPDPKISIIEVTARSDYPTMGRGINDPKPLHLWEPTLQTLLKQTEKSFEYVVVDLFYDERPDYFKDHNYGFRIKHVPVMPNPWHEGKLCQICHQFNTGIIHADGELLYFQADSGMYPPWLLWNLWKRYQEGHFISLGFGADVTYGPKELQDFARDQVVPTDWYRFLDFYGHIQMDHRYNKLFEGNNTNFSIIPPSWYYGSSTASLEAMLKINGFDQAFDPGTTESDIDVGNRLDLAGYKLAMARECYSIEAYADKWHNAMKKPEVLCSHALMLYNKATGRVRANESFPGSEMIDEKIINLSCRRLCEVIPTCRTLPHRGPFFNKNEPEAYNLWRNVASQESINLQYEREDRIDGSNYTEGTFVNI